MQEADRPDGLAHLKIFSLTEIERSGRNKVLRTQPCPGNHIEGEAERLVGVHIKDIMQHFQAFIAGHRLRLHTEGFEIVENIRFDPFQLCFCSAKRICLNAEGDVLVLEKAVISFGELILQHLGILAADVIESVILFRDTDGLLELIDIRPLVDERKLHKDCAVKVVQEITPVFKNSGLILVLGKLVVDVVKTDGFGVKAAIYLADAIPAHFHIGDSLLCGFGDFLGVLVFFHLRDNPLLFSSRQRIAIYFSIFDGLLGNCRLRIFAQSATPPVLRFPAGLQRTDYAFCTDAPYPSETWP